MIGFVGMMLMGLPGPINTEQKKQLDMVHHNARYLLDLINDVLDISRIEAGELTILTEPVDIIPAVVMVVKAMQPIADKKGLIIETDLDPETGMITGEKRRVEQVIMNLLSNAIKFTDSGMITLKTQVKSGEIILSVRDTGIGMKEEDLEKLFQPFCQADPGTGRGYEGTGLGLSISKKLVELHGGRITAHSTIGKGSCFRVYLPIRESNRE
jgi:signal transduction histidine kinase